MNDKFKAKYCRESKHLASWDYSSAGSHFITICTQNRIDWFGEIEEDMNLTMGEYVVMPNHFHASLIIAENIYNQQERKAWRSGSKN